LNCVSIPFRETPEKIIGRIWYFREIHHQLPVPLQSPAEIVQLHPSEVLFHRLFEGTAVGIAIADLQAGRIVKSNSAFQQMLGYTVDELETLTFQDLTHPDDLRSDLVLHQEMLAGYRENFQLEKRYIRQNGQIIWARLSVSLARNVQGIPQFSIGVIENITSHKQVEEALLEVTKAVESCCDAIAITDISGIPTFINPAFLELFGYSLDDLKDAGGLATLYRDQSEVEAMFSAIQQGLSWRNEQPMYSRTGREIQILLRVNAMTNQAGEVIGLVSIYTDISERKRSEIILQESEQALRQKTQQLEQTLADLTYAQAQLIQQEKMLSLGQLVAGVAHEINNPVSFIYGNIEHAKDYIKDLLDLLALYQKHYPQPASEIQAKTQEIDLNFLVEDLPNLLLSMKMGSERICNLILSLRNFCRLDEAQKKSVDIHEGIESTLILLQNRLKTKGEKPAIQLIKHYGDLPNIECYPGQLNQVFMNLLTNAIDALDEIQAQRKITIQTEILDAKAVRIAVNEPLPHAAENFVVIRFKDNGPGIAPIYQSKLFDPFFTTKPIGKGTGLGLAIAYQIITQKHQGIFKCFSQIGQGAEFLIAIPILGFPSGSLQVPFYS
jgi:two-component system NtrC family sensor kinase